MLNACIIVMTKFFFHLSCNQAHSRSADWQLRHGERTSQKQFISGNFTPPIKANTKVLENLRVFIFLPLKPSFKSIIHTLPARDRRVAHPFRLLRTTERSQHFLSDPPDFPNHELFFKGYALGMSRFVPTAHAHLL
jgi:hypothetical protein